MKSKLLDSHCHLDRYRDPGSVAALTDDKNVFVVAVTNLPSHFHAGLPHVRGLKNIRLAIGLHPLAAKDHAGERDLFCKSLALSSFVGEVGLDFSREGKATRDIQLESFRLVAGQVASTHKVVSIHSRGAEGDVLDILAEFNVGPVIFHWYSGPLGLLDEAVNSGHFFSVNPSMTNSANGRRIIDRVPPDRLITETDGPYVKIGRDAAMPWDVSCVEEYLGDVWDNSNEDVNARIWNNFRQMLSKLGLLADVQSSSTALF